MIRDVRPNRPPVGLPPVVLVEFFATWCSACRRSLTDTLAALSTLAEADAARVELIVMDVGEKDEDVRRYFTRIALPERATVVVDGDRKAYAAWGVTRLPTLFIIDSSGTIRHINRGHGSGFRVRLLSWLSRRLGEQ